MSPTLILLFSAIFVRQVRLSSQYSAFPLMIPLSEVFLSIADALVSGERIVLTRQVVSSTSLTQPIRPFSVITGSFFPHCLLNPCQE